MNLTVAVNSQNRDLAVKIAQLELIPLVSAFEYVNCLKTSF